MPGKMSDFLKTQARELALEVAANLTYENDRTYRNNYAYEIGLPVESGVFNIVHPELGIIATIKVTETEDEMYTVEIEETPL